VIKTVGNTGILLLLLIVGHLIYRHEDGRFELPSTPPQGSFSSDLPPGDFSSPPSSQPPPLEEETPAPPKKKHFWNRKADPDQGVERGHEGSLDDDIPRQMVIPQRGAAGYTGAKVLVWERGPNGEVTCPPGEHLIQMIEANTLGWTIGESPQFHFWVVRVPVYSEKCPKIVFYENGRPRQDVILGCPRPDHLPLVFAKHPLANPDVETWGPACGTSISTRQRYGAPVWNARPLPPGGLPATPAAANWGPGIGVRYRSNTDLGVGFGFGSAWSNAPCGG
jgi:hypothetical protein